MSVHFHLRGRSERYRPLSRQPQVRKLDLERITEVENLLRSYRDCAAHRGQAKGGDHFGYGDAGSSEVAGMLRQLRSEVLDETYHPGPIRRVRIPKLDTCSHRELMIRPILDRVLSVALDAPLAYRAEPLFLPGNHGFRCRRSHLTCLARLAAQVESGNRFLIHDDLLTAFDQISVDVAIETLRQLGGSEALLAVVRKLLEKRQNTPSGICQGDSLSPLAMNLVLNDVHDLPLSQSCGRSSWLRYVDNVIYSGDSTSDVERLYHEATNHISRASLHLKSSRVPDMGRVIDLRSTWVSIFGFRLRAFQDTVEFRVECNAWNALSDVLERAHVEANPIQNATAVTAAWIRSRAPALLGAENKVAVRIQANLARNGFHELAADIRIHRWLNKAVESWRGLMERARAN
jgi:hypothetical protein